MHISNQRLVWEHEELLHIKRNHKPVKQKRDLIRQLTEKKTQKASKYAMKLGLTSQRNTYQNKEYVFTMIKLTTQAIPVMGKAGSNTSLTQRLGAGHVIQESQGCPKHFWYCTPEMFAHSKGTDTQDHMYHVILFTEDGLEIWK